MRLKNGLITEEQYDPAKFAKDGLVLAICESNFPHQISFMLIEPCSHIQWEYSYFDSKLNVIETRQQRLNFVSNLFNGLKNGILRDIHDPERALSVVTGAQKQTGGNQDRDTLYTTGKLAELFTNQRPGSPSELIFRKSVEIAPGVFRSLIIESDASMEKIVLQIQPLDEDLATNPHLCHKHHILIGSQREGSRIVSGCFASGLHEGVMTVSSHLKNMFYTVEVACATQDTEKAVRFTIFDQAKEATILSMTFLDSSLLERERELHLREEVKFAVRSGFTDSVAIVQKMSCLNYDYKRLELNQQIKM